MLSIYKVNFECLASGGSSSIDTNTCSSLNENSHVKQMSEQSVSQPTLILSKSRYLKGRQCQKWLYLDCFKPEAADKIGLTDQHKFDVGQQIGQDARQLYPKGFLVKEGATELQKALETTQNAINTGHSVIYEGTFLYSNVQVKVDVLNRINNETFDLIEVKSGTDTKTTYIEDVALQLYVLQGAGVKIEKAYIMHVNNSYIHQGDKILLDEFFKLVDVTEQVLPLMDSIEDHLNGMHKTLSYLEEPNIPTGKHCNKPNTCSFIGYCHVNQTEYPITDFPRLSEKLEKTFQENGFKDIRDIPRNFKGLSPKYLLIKDCVDSNKPYFSVGLQSALEKITYPICFIDFETTSPAKPRYPGTKPYQQIPFQWSAHLLQENGQVSHYEHLHDGIDDPRLPFLISLLEVLERSSTVVVYSNFEKTQLNALAREFVEYADSINNVIERIVDLCAIIQEHCYHPEFHGSYSIKSVLPALVPGLSYKDLEIQNGQVAIIAFEEMIDPGTSFEQKNELKSALLAYCKRDTEALLKLHDTLKQITVKK